MSEVAKMLFTIAAPAAALISFVAYDRFVKRFAEELPEIWRLKNCPLGFLWRPVEGGSWKGHQARQTFLAEVSFGVPKWMRAHPGVVKALRFYHVTYWSFLILSLLILLLIMSRSLR
ncbi:hypothetical protein [Verrucomicrobium sp. BvORR106]|uniref:hypothetical protein n=1 Tax=Verrucomicrobium sp. BvORR106 TaxID=1403819 RepID=UPI000571A9F1|nr:hypothetical protein [Verrucomicrobium sp. BvORR106]